MHASERNGLKGVYQNRQRDSTATAPRAVRKVTPAEVPIAKELRFQRRHSWPRHCTTPTRDHLVKQHTLALFALSSLWIAHCGQSVRPELAPPRLRWPLSTARVATSRPVLRWIEEDTIQSRRDVHLCRDRAMTRDCRVQTAHDRATELAIDAPLETGRWFWTVTSRGARVDARDTVWQFIARPGEIQRNRSWGSRPDFDNDGFDDVLLSNVGSHGAEVHLVFGGPSLGALRRRRVEAPRDWLLGGRDAHLRDARHLQDVDGDGRSEIVLPVGRTNPTADVEDARATPFLWAFAVLQSRDDFAPSEAVIFPVQSSEGLSSVSAVGDLDGDGFGDVIVYDDWEPTRVRACFGSRTGLDPRRCASASLSDVTVAPNFIGRGDTDGDGADEFLFTASRPALFEGRVRLGDRASLAVRPLVGLEPDQRVTSSPGLIDASGRGEPEFAVFEAGNGRVYLAPLVIGLRSSVIATHGWTRSCHVVDGREGAAGDELFCAGPRTREGFVVRRVFPDATVTFGTDARVGAFIDLDGDSRPELVVPANDPEHCSLRVYDSRTFELRETITVTEARSSCYVPLR